MGVSRSAVGNYERNIRTPDHDQMDAIADHFNVDMDYLFGRTNIPNRYQASLKPINTIPITTTIDIPLLGKIACGDPITAVENVDEYIPRPSHDLPAGDLYYLTATGDSMAPLIPDGSIVLCRAQEGVENGEIASVLLNNGEEATLKKVRKLDNYWVLEPLNPIFDPIIINGDNSCRIIGKVLEVTIKLGG